MSEEKDRAEDYCFTLHNGPCGTPFSKENYDVFCDKIYTDLVAKGVKAMTMQAECGANGKFHIQGFLQWPRRVVFNKMRSILQLMSKGAHIEIRRGTVLQAVKYATKQQPEFADGQIPDTKRWHHGGWFCLGFNSNMYIHVCGELLYMPGGVDSFTMPLTTNHHVASNHELKHHF